MYPAPADDESSMRRQSLHIRGPKTFSTAIIWNYSIGKPPRDMLDLTGKRMRSTTGRGHPAAKKARKEAHDAPRSRVTELDVEWEDLLEKKNNSLLNRLVQENRELELTFQQFQAKMESILLCSKECLESTQNVKIDNRICGSQSIIHAEQNGKRCHDSYGNEPVINRASKSPSIPQDNLPSVSLSSSIIFQATVIAGQTPRVDQDISPNDLCESIMAWKVRSGQCWDFTFLLSHFQWQELSSLLKTDTTIKLMNASNFYPLLLESILRGTELAELQSQDAQSPGQRWNFGMTHQRRSVAFCAYVLVKQYRPYATSQLVTVVQFWLLLNLLIFMTFPTEENLRKIPPWLWPTERQLFQDHPGVIDFVIWPGVRSNLVQNWRNYKLPELLADLTRNLEFYCAQSVLSSAAITEASDGTQLEIDPTFEKTILDLSNYRIGPRFHQKYPDLAQCFGPCDGVSNKHIIE